MTKAHRSWQEKKRAERFREERERIGFSSRALSEIFFGISPSYLSKIERGEAPITRDHLEIAARLGIDVAYVMNGRRSSEGTLAWIEQQIGFATIGARISSEMGRSDCEARHA